MSQSALAFIIADSWHSRDETYGMFSFQTVLSFVSAPSSLYISFSSNLLSPHSDNNDWIAGQRHRTVPETICLPGFQVQTQIKTSPRTANSRARNIFQTLEGNRLCRPCFLWFSIIALMLSQRNVISVLMLNYQFPICIRIR